MGFKPLFDIACRIESLRHMLRIPNAMEVYRIKPLILSYHLQKPDLLSTGRAFLLFVQIPMNFALKMESGRVILFTIFRGVDFGWRG